MEQIQRPDEQVGDADHVQVFIFLHFAGIPGHDKNGESNDDGEKFHQGMKKHVAMLFAESKDEHQAKDAECGTVITADKGDDWLQGSGLIPQR